MLSASRSELTGSERSAWPIVVGGCHRAGTSLVRRILDAHSRIHCGPEVPFFRDFFGEYRADPYAHLRFSQAARSLLDEDELIEVLGGSLVALHERAATKAGKARWADKAPENLLYVASWDRLLKSRCVRVAVVRNPLDTISSMKERPFPLTLPPDLGGRIDHWRQMTRIALELAEIEPDRSKIVVYEDLVTDPSKVIGELMTWLGEAVEQAQLRPNSVAHEPGLEDPKAAETSSIHADSVSSWRGLLRAEEAAQIWEATGELWSLVDAGRGFAETP